MSTRRNPEFAIDPIFVNRWSPRAFTGEAIDETTRLSPRCSIARLHV